jgi:hypothetical protein
MSMCFQPITLSDTSPWGRMWFAEKRSYFTSGHTPRGAGISQSEERLPTSWKIRGSNFGGGRGWDFPHPYKPSSLLYNGYRVSLPGAERPGGGVDHPSPSSPDGKERVHLYLYSSYGPSWSFTYDEIARTSLPNWNYTMVRSKFLFF